MKWTPIIAALALAACANLPRETSAVVECDVGAAGAVDNCVLVSEAHPGSGFGEQAIAAVAKGKVRLDPGRTTPAKFRTTVRGRLDG